MVGQEIVVRTVPSQGHVGFRRDRPASSDAILWALDRDPVPRSAMTAATELDREPVLDEVVRRLETVCRHSDHFRSIVVPACAPGDRPRWKEDGHFDIAANEQSK